MDYEVASHVVETATGEELVRCTAVCYVITEICCDGSLAVDLWSTYIEASFDTSRIVSLCKKRAGSIWRFERLGSISVFCLKVGLRGCCTSSQVQAVGKQCSDSM